ncbi:hypothetical protein C5167_016636 [Papaver somniferum]|nr:hypothetical protein C5167_016636 [Papaver somniferum]
MSCLLSCCASLSCGLCTSVASGISGRSVTVVYLVFLLSLHGFLEKSVLLSLSISHRKAQKAQ